MLLFYNNDWDCLDRLSELIWNKKWDFWLYKMRRQNPLTWVRPEFHHTGEVTSSIQNQKTIFLKPAMNIDKTSKHLLVSKGSSSFSHKSNLSILVQFYRAAFSNIHTISISFSQNSETTGDSKSTGTKTLWVLTRHSIVHFWSEYRYMR